MLGDRELDDASHSESPAKSEALSGLQHARSLALVCRNLFREPSALLSVGRFELVRTRGRGGMGVVYEAYDPQRRERVALKMLHGRGPNQLYRLKREFRSLAELRHPNLVALHELSVLDDEAYFTMDLIEGRDFVSHARDGAAPGTWVRDDMRVRDALLQLCDGVAALHAAGKLHRDLKPSNVLVTSEGRVVLLDFGLVGDAHDGAFALEGTPAYIAPEQARGEASAASDWYSVGLMLRESLRGTRAAWDDVDREHHVLASLARRLADPEPARRPRYEEIVALLRGETKHSPAAHPTAATRFVGRELELRALREAFARSCTQLVALLVRGESGIGKSALLRELAAGVLEPADALVLEGRCYERESIPFKAFDGVIDGLSHHLLGWPAERAAELRLDDGGALLQIFPVLGRVPWLRPHGARTEEVRPTELRARAFAALKQLLQQLAQRQPVVILLEDLQWSDGDSGRLLGALTCCEHPPAMLVIATERGGSGPNDGMLDELHGLAKLAAWPLSLTTLDLAGLSPADASQLAAELLAARGDRQPAEHVARLAEGARGNPLLLSELTHWIASKPRAPGAPALPSIDALFDARARSLSEPSGRILQLVAVAGCRLPLAVAAHAAGMVLPLQAQIAELGAARLVRSVRRGTDQLLELDHDRIAHGVLRDLPASERVALHARLALAFEAEQGQDSDALIEQYLGAMQPSEAARCARRAAGRALDLLAFSRAARLYATALRVGDFTRAERAALERDRAQALEQAGQGLEAAAAFERAAALDGDPQSAAQLEQRAARHLMHNGKHREGELLLRKGYAALGLHWPRGRVALSLAIIKLLLPFRLRRLVHARRATSVALRRTRAEFLSGAGAGLENYDALRATYNALLCFDESEQLPDPIWHARAAGARGMMRCLGVGLYGARRGIAALEGACRVAAELGDVPAQADLERQLATAHYFACRPRAALAAAERTEVCLRALPLIPMDLYVLMGILGSALIELGELRAARGRWSSFAYEARLHGDLPTSTWVHLHPAQLALLFAADERARARAILTQQARRRELHPSYRPIAWAHAQCRVEHALYWGAPDEAERIARDEQRTLFQSGYAFLSERARLTRARARLAAAGSLPAGSTGRARLLRAARADAAAWRTSAEPLKQGTAGLVDAGILFLQGHRERASARLEAATQQLDAAGAKLAAACARHCRGVLIGGEQGAALLCVAGQTLADEGVREPVRWVASAVSGFRAVLDVPS